MAQWDWGFGRNGQSTEKWTFVVDTNMYAGGFERELCAWVVGRADKYASVDDIIALFRRDYPRKNPFESIVEFRRISLGDDANFESPCDLVPTPGRVNNGLGRCFSAKTYKGKERYPAYESVGIFLSKRPSQRVIDVLKTRAWNFPLIDHARPGFVLPKIRGCRLVCETTRLDALRLR